MTRRAAWSRAAAALVVLCFDPVAHPATKRYVEPVRLAIDHLLAVQQPSGLFLYAFDFLEDAAAETEVISGANLTRQAGTASAVADYYALTHDPRAVDTLRRLLRAFEARSLPIGKSRAQAFVESTGLLSAPIGRYKIRAALGHYGLLYQKSGPGKVVSPNTAYTEAYAGLLALCLLTEIRYSQASGDQSFAPLRQAWLEGLLALRIPGDGFRERPDSIDTSAYFDGEAWLALAEYHRAFPHDHRVAEVLDELDIDLPGKYRDAPGGAFFHWGVMAAAVRFATNRDPRLLDFMKRQTTGFLARSKGRGLHDNRCAAAEGVADVMGALRDAGEGDSPLFKQSQQWNAAELAKARTLQIQPGQQELVFAKARIYAPRMREFAGGFRGGVLRANTQIDYTQHCMSAMLKMTRHGLD